MEQILLNDADSRMAVWSGGMTRFALIAGLLLSFGLPEIWGQEWSTYRGNPARTGNVDGKAGPTEPKVLWATPAKEHFVAALVPVGEKGLYVAGIGALNRPSISVVPLADGKKPIWSRSVPYLRLLSVSSPAVTSQVIAFGDGMHQDSGGVLHCLTADTGRPLWQLSLEGNLNHLEGAPTILDGKVYMGGGAAGVVCVELNRILFEGKEISAKEMAQKQEERWKELLAAYEQKKKVDPDLAVPPTEDDLHKPAPKLLWQKGKDRWHVDAPVNVVEGKVLVCTSYLEKEKVGERAICCLDAKTGETLWTTPLALNPWGGAAVLGETVVVTGSSVGYYFKDIRGAKGLVTALSLKTGKTLWSKPIPSGGIVGTAALSGDLAITTATDGKIRAFDLKTGERRWLADVQGPVFAPPAIAGKWVYVGDLQGKVHALDLQTGVPKWQLDLGTTEGVRAPGMIYGGVTVHEGTLYLGTVNLEGPHVEKPTVLVRIGQK
jgi:outer membrane protein assembly factor BamB